MVDRLSFIWPMGVRKVLSIYVLMIDQKEFINEKYGFNVNFWSIVAMD